MKNQITIALVACLFGVGLSATGSPQSWRDTATCENAEYTIYYSHANQAASVRGPQEEIPALMSCTSEGGQICQEQGVADAGYRLVLTPLSGNPWRAHLYEITIAGEKLLTEIVCVYDPR